MPQNRQVFRRLLFSYIILIFLAALGAGTALLKAEKIVKEITLFGHRAALQQLADNLDILFSDAERGSVYVYKSMEDTLRDVQDWNDLDVRRRTQEILKSLEITRKGLHPLLFYKGEVLSPSMILKPDEFHRSFLDSSELSIEQWEEILNRYHYSSLFSINYRIAPDRRSETLALIMSDIFAFGRNTAPANIIIFIEHGAFLNLMEENNWLTLGDIFLLNRQDQLLFSSIPRDRISENLPGNQNPLFHTSGQTYLQTHLSYGGLRLIMRYPDHLFQKQARLLRYFTAVCLLVILIIGALLSYIFSNRQYSPIEDLMIILKRNRTEGFASSQSLSEYQYIRNGLLQIIEEKESIHSRLESQQSTLNRYFTGRVLQGQIEGVNEELHDYFLQRGMVPPTNEYVVAVFHLENEPDNPILNLTEYIEKLSVQDSYLIAWGAIVQSYSALILFTEEKTQGFLREKLNTIRNKALKTDRLSFSIGLSNIHSDFSRMPDAFRESLGALDQRLLSSGGGCFTAKEPSFVGKGSNLFKLTLTRKFTNTILSGEYRNALNLMNEEFQQLKQDTSLSPEAVRIRLTGMLNLLLEGISEAGRLLDQDFSEQLQAFEILSRCSTIGQMQSEMAVLMNTIIREAEEQKKNDSRDNVVEQVQKIVAAHLTDPQINVNFIAEKSGWPVPTLSAKFRKATGSGLLDYIHNERLMVAKDLLRNEPELSIKEISRKLGYWDYNAFIKIFKKYEGVTPGRFRTS